MVQVNKPEKRLACLDSLRKHTKGKASNFTTRMVTYLEILNIIGSNIACSFGSPSPSQPTFPLPVYLTEKPQRKTKNDKKGKNYTLKLS